MPGAPEAVTMTVIGLHDRSILSCSEVLEAGRPVGVEHRLHRLAHRRAVERPDLRVRQELQPLERTAFELLVRAPVAPVLVRIRAVVLRVEERRLHHVDRAGDRGLHVLRVRVVPGDDRIEAVVEIDVGPDRVVRDPVAELAQPRDRALAVRRIEVVEDRPRHQEPRRPCALLGLHLCDRERAVERQVDVVAQDQVARLGRAVEARIPVAAALRRAQQLAVVREGERAAHSTSTSRRVAAASARSSASRFVSAVAIT